MLFLLKTLLSIFLIAASVIYLVNFVINRNVFIGNEFTDTRNRYQTHKHEKIMHSADPQATTFDKKTFFEHLDHESNKLFLINCNFYHCQQNSLMFYGSNGGAILISAISIDIDHCKFRQNYALQNGGAAYIQSSSNVQITDTIVSSNTADNFCGGIFLFNVFKSKITNTNFSSNSASEVSSLSTIYCRNCITKNNIFYKNTATSNGTLFIEKSKFSDESSSFIHNTATIASSIILGGFSEVFFKNTAFFDKKENYSISSSPSDVSTFTNCLFTKKFQIEFQSNGAKVTESGSTVIHKPLYVNLISYPPVPTYPPLRTPNQTISAGSNNNNQSNRSDQSTSALTQWKSLIAFLYIFFIVMLVYVLANHFSWFPRRVARITPFDGNRLLRRSRSNLSLS